MMKFTAETIAGFLGGVVEGDSKAEVSTVCKIEEGHPGGLSFLSNPKYEEYIYTSGASIVIVSEDFEARGPIAATLVRVPNAYEAFASLLDLYAASRPRPVGISDRASVAENATLGQEVYVGDFAVVEAGASVGNGTAVYPQTYIGAGVKIGEGCTIYAGVKIYEGCVVGDRVTIHAGTVVGADGFGFAPTADGSYRKIPQIGNVVIKDDVELGANVCIDRATMGSTVVERGVKIDNLVQIAHNVSVGEHTVMASQCGVAGSTKIGAHVMMGGQVGIVGHISIADGVKIGSQSGINNSIQNANETVFGSPAMSGMAYHRSHAVFKELPALRTQVAKATKEIEELKKK